ncbi:hypothetical protein AB205_0011640, partial [Aquarana catesbeiana]
FFYRLCIWFRSLALQTQSLRLLTSCAFGFDQLHCNPDLSDSPTSFAFGFDQLHFSPDISDSTD